MTKQNIIITGFEDSEDKTRTRFQTNKGWMSAFKNEGSTLITDLKQHVETLISVEAVPSKQLNKAGDPYINIRTYYGLSESDDEEQPKTPVKSEGVTQKQVEEHVSKNSNDGPKSMYVSYAKDIFVDVFQPGDDATSTMEEAIKLVKQAREAF